jgi:hypothetical protein
LSAFERLANGGYDDGSRVDEIYLDQRTEEERSIVLRRLKLLANGGDDVEEKTDGAENGGDDAEEKTDVGENAEGRTTVSDNESERCTEYV